MLFLFFVLAEACRRQETVCKDNSSCCEGYCRLGLCVASDCGDAQRHPLLGVEDGQNCDSTSLCCSVSKDGFCVPFPCRGDAKRLILQAVALARLHPVAAGQSIPMERASYEVGFLWRYASPHRSKSAAGIGDYGVFDNDQRSHRDPPVLRSHTRRPFPERIETDICPVPTYHKLHGPGARHGVPHWGEARVRSTLQRRVCRPRPDSGRRGRRSPLGSVCCHSDIRFCWCLRHLDFSVGISTWPVPQTGRGSSAPALGGGGGGGDGGDGGDGGACGASSRKPFSSDSPVKISLLNSP
jgi:hypothetical protein